MPQMRFGEAMLPRPSSRRLPCSPGLEPPTPAHDFERFYASDCAWSGKVGPGWWVEWQRRLMKWEC